MSRDSYLIPMFPSFRGLLFCILHGNCIDEDSYTRRLSFIFMPLATFQPLHGGLIYTMFVVFDYVILGIPASRFVVH